LLETSSTDQLQVEPFAGSNAGKLSRLIAGCRCFSHKGMYWQRDSHFYDVLQGACQAM
jgi:hypothetical protein